MDYFTFIFLASEERGSMKFVEMLKGWVTNQIKEGLSPEYRIEEIEKALKQMYLTKAFGPYGMPFLFYQKH